MFNKQRFEGAVSPVVGVILMVAVTVILAAVIGSFVLDLGSNVQQNPNAGVTFDDDGTNVTVQVISMENADGLYVKNADGQFYDGTDVDGNVQWSDSEPADYSLSGTGQSVEVPHNDGKVTVIGELNGKQSVIQSHQP